MRVAVLYKRAGDNWVRVDSISVGCYHVGRATAVQEMVNFLVLHPSADYVSWRENGETYKLVA